MNCLNKVVSMYFQNESPLIQPVEGGWSNDEKFHVWSRCSETDYLLRFSPLSDLEVKRQEFYALKTIKNNRLLKAGRFSEPIDFLELYDDNMVCMVLKWVKGKNIEDGICDYDIKERYNLGVSAGFALRSLHRIPAHISNEQRKTILLNKLITRHSSCIKMSADVTIAEPLLKFICDNLSICYERNPTFLHGDYQGRNLIITNSDVAVIDFNRFCEGDPLYDFSRLPQFTVLFDESFSCGQIDGYFEGDVPRHFFKRMMFYAGFATLNSFFYSIIEDDRKVFVSMRDCVDRIMNDTFYSEDFIPTWYRKHNS